jgi:hypothetical protein
LLKLTPMGTEVHAALVERIQATRQRLVRGVTQEEYLATVDVLAGWPGTSNAARNEDARAGHPSAGARAAIGARSVAPPSLAQAG